jgi:hypothetical protein
MRPGRPGRCAGRRGDLRLALESSPAAAHQPHTPRSRHWPIAATGP